ncbi:MAG: hypothetical protein DRO36_06385 [Candidatus Hecatellales archaeon]|nr:MAG: hypothetical protein DRO36_06385 [Candidatus Hecatellales archaeon]
MGKVSKDFFKKRIVKIEDESYDEVPIAIGTPFYNPLPFIDQYFISLLKLDYPRDLISLYWTFQGDDESESLLYWFEKKYGKEYRKIRIKKFPLIRNTDRNHTYNIVRNRNWIIDASSPDLLLFIDHDNFPPPYTIKRLLINLNYCDIATGVYPFFQEGKLGFTAFFLEGNSAYHLALHKEGNKLYFPSEILGERLYSDAIGTGTCMVKREVLDKVRFEVPPNLMTEDTYWSLRARKLGFKIISDFGLMVPHWGFKLIFGKDDGKRVEVKAYLSRRMNERRKEMEDSKVYTPVFKRKGLNRKKKV